LESGGDGGEKGRRRARALTDCMSTTTARARADRRRRIVCSAGRRRTANRWLKRMGTM
jgi:hypothetical protein